MPLSVPNTASTDAFVKWGNGLFVNGWIQVLAKTGVTTGGGIDVFVEHKPGGGQSPVEQQAFVQLIPGAYPVAGSPVDPIVSVSVRSHVAGSPAMYSMLLVEENKAGIGAGAQLLGSISSTGSFTGAGGSVVTGIVDSAGAIVGGTGFSVVHGGPGDYTVTFSPAFAAAPVVNVTILSAGNWLSPAITSPPSASGFHVVFTISGAGATDTPWNFVAEATA